MACIQPCPSFYEDAPCQEWTFNRRGAVNGHGPFSEPIGHSLVRGLVVKRGLKRAAEDPFWKRTDVRAWESGVETRGDTGLPPPSKSTPPRPKSAGPLLPTRCLIPDHRLINPLPTHTALADSGPILSAHPTILLNRSFSDISQRTSVNNNARDTPPPLTMRPRRLEPQT